MTRLIVPTDIKKIVLIGDFGNSPAVANIFTKENLHSHHSPQRNKRV